MGYRLGVLRARGVAVWFGVASALLSTLACNDSGRGRSTDAGSFIEPDAQGDAADAADAADADGAPDEGSLDSAPPGFPDALAPPCNGSSELCKQRFSALAFLGTHLSPATDSSWATQTQGRSLKDQLQVGGVRVLELEVHSDGGVLAVCAGSCSLGSQSLSSVLREVATFLTGNETDVLTLVLRDFAPTSALVKAFDDQNLPALARTQTPGEPWPTLQEMIDAKQRLVVFIDELPAGTSDAGEPDASADGGLPQWLHPLADWAWETAPSEATDCVIARGDASLPLAILNHYVPGEAPADPQLVAAHMAETVAARLQRCVDDRGHVPNFVFVDFAEVGDPNGGTQIADGLR